MRDAGAERDARELLSRLAMPPGALGGLGDLGVELAGIAGECPPPLPVPAVVAVFAGAHGVVAQGITPWPSEVTAQMVATFCAGGAAINALAFSVPLPPQHGSKVLGSWRVSVEPRRTHVLGQLQHNFRRELSEVSTFRVRHSP